MRTLYEIIDSAKAGEMPTHEECYWAMLVFHFLENMDNIDLVRLSSREHKSDKPVLGVTWFAEESCRRVKTALEKDPKEFIGWNNDPANPEVQERRKRALKIFNKISKKMEEDHHDRT